MQYADLILPVPLQGLFTYAVPEDMAVGVGCRVLVGFGRNKTYLGIVARLHDQKPEAKRNNAKYIVNLKPLRFP